MIKKGHLNPFSQKKFILPLTLNSQVMTWQRQIKFLFCSSPLICSVMVLIDNEFLFLIWSILAFPLYYETQNPHAMSSTCSYLGLLLVSRWKKKSSNTHFFHLLHSTIKFTSASHLISSSNNDIVSKQSQALCHTSLLSMFLAVLLPWTFLYLVLIKWKNCAFLKAFGL